MVDLIAFFGYNPLVCPNMGIYKVSLRPDIPAVEHFDFEEVY